MKKQINAVLYDIAEKVMEKLAYILSFPEEGMSEIDYQQAIAAKVSFNGPFTGTLAMFISSEILPEMTANMLGFENSNDTTIDMQHDALKELINVICGNLLPAIAGKEAVFNVETPVIIPNASDFIKDREPVAVARLPLEQGQCDLLLFVDGKFPE